MFLLCSVFLTISFMPQRWVATLAWCLRCKGARKKDEGEERNGLEVREVYNHASTTLWLARLSYYI